MDATTTSTSSSCAKENHEARSQAMGQRRPTIRDISEAAQKQKQCKHTEPRHPPSQAASGPSCWFVQDDAEDDSPPPPWPAHPHFLDECRMCGRHLTWDQDIYMYMGDAPFCSEQCRDEQVQIDEARERSRRRRHVVSPDNQAMMGKSEAAAAVAVVAV